MRKPRFTPPAVHNGIQYNTCKNPKCSNYGVTPEEQPDAYGLQYAGKGFPLLKCNACGEVPPLKSNEGIYDEIQRLKAHMRPDVLACTNQDCTNHGVPVDTPKAYRKHGTTAKGMPRYRCNGCGKTVNQTKTNTRQRVTHHNIDIFKMLVNKVPLSRIVEMLDISWDLLYHRIDFIHTQCMRFVANRERKLADMEFERLYISVDRQDHTINWTDRKDKRNVVLSAITSVCNSTGYVFGVHPNFDPNMDNTAVEALAAAHGDATLPEPFQKTARLWKSFDYSKATSGGKRAKLVGFDVLDRVQNKYDEFASREDVEAFDRKNGVEALPNYGVQIHGQYTMIAHFYYLKDLLAKNKKWRFFLDQESGIRAAVLAAFSTEVKEKRAEAFYVSINKEMTVDDKRLLTNEARVRMRQLKRLYPELSDSEIKLELLKGAIAAVSQIGQWKDRWVKHPMPDMSEPEKAMCWLTEHDTFDEDHVAWLYNKATLHGVDNFFQKVRRRMSLFERSINSASSSGRVWNGYSAYNPAIVGKLLDIFRVVHNYVDTREKKDEDPSTAAMRIGLAQVPTKYKDILYFE